MTTNNNQSKELGVLNESFLALKAEKDPFYILQSDSCREDAQWFKDQWDMCGYTSGVHLRRMHYQLVSQEPKVRMRNGEQYVNTDKCWKALGNASLAARYLDMVNPLCFVDRRNGDEYDKADYDTERDIDISINDNAYLSGIDIDVVEDIHLPDYKLDVTQPQPYHLEIWCEKSTQDDILLRAFEKSRLTGLTHHTGVVRLRAVRHKSGASERRHC